MSPIVQRVGNLPGWLRPKITNLFAPGVEPDSHIAWSVSIRGSRNIRLGSYSVITDDAVLDARDGSISIGCRCHINGARLISNGGSISIGDNCTVNPFAVLYGHGGLSIGNNVMIATGSVIVPANHCFDSLDVPMKLQGLTTLGISIDDNVWVGANVTILDGVHIGTGSIVAAGAVVTRNVLPMTIVAGVPAKQIGLRGSEKS